MCQSSSISGPSERVKPIRLKISIISFLTNDKGCLLPSWSSVTGLDKSKPEDCWALSEKLAFPSSNLYRIAS